MLFYRTFHRFYRKFNFCPDATTFNAPKCECNELLTYTTEISFTEISAKK